MTPALNVEILGTIKQELYTPGPQRVGVRMEAPSFVIGSQPANRPAVLLQDETVSRIHAEVSAFNDIWSIKDLDSNNGIVLLPETMNFGAVIARSALHGERIRETRIEPKVTLAIGAVVIRLSVEDRAAAMRRIGTTGP